jgi:hypothetical protein
MTRTALIVFEILIGVAALGGEVYLLVIAGSAPADGKGSAASKSRLVVDLVILDAVAALMFVAAWQVISNGSAARVLSIVAGMAVAFAVVARPTLAGLRQTISSLFVLLGLVVVILAIVSPAPG